MNMLRKRILVCTLALAAFLTTATAAPAAAAGQATDMTNSTGLLLTIAQGEEPYPAREAALLTCEPAGGSHPSPAAAFALLAAADGDVAAVEVRPGRPCVLVYAPVTVTARGHWKGRTVDYRETFPNTCVLQVVKGSLFGF
jgi:hypothetical protein